MQNHFREKLKTFERFPCEGQDAQVAHVKKHRVPSHWLRKMFVFTQIKMRCCWLSCPAFEVCGLSLWGEQNPEREEAENIFLELAGEFGHRAFSNSDQEFLDSLVTRMENSPKYIPTRRQMNWLENIYNKWRETQ